MALTDEQKSANTIAAAWGIIDSERAANARLIEQIAQLEQAVRYESDLCQQALDSREQLEQQLAEARKDADKFHEVMGYMRDMKLEHGTCLPRYRMACTNCNAAEKMTDLVRAYRGPSVIAATARTQEQG